MGMDGRSVLGRGSGLGGLSGAVRAVVLVPEGQPDREDRQEAGRKDQVAHQQVDDSVDRDTGPADADEDDQRGVGHGSTCSCSFPAMARRAGSTRGTTMTRRSYAMQ